MRSTPQSAEKPAGDQVGHLWWRILHGELPAVNHPGILVILIGANERVMRCPGLESSRVCLHTTMRGYQHITQRCVVGRGQWRGGTTYDNQFLSALTLPITIWDRKPVLS